jgi:hypothetical protein
MFFEHHALHAISHAVQIVRGKRIPVSASTHLVLPRISLDKAGTALGLFAALRNCDTA